MPNNHNLHIVVILPLPTCLLPNFHFLAKYSRVQNSWEKKKFRQGGIFGMVVFTSSKVNK